MKPLVLDLDGVVRVWDPLIMASAEERNGLPTGALKAAILDPERITEAVTGRITDEQWRAEITRVLANEHGYAAAEAAVRQWSEPAGAVDGEVLRIVRRERRRRTVAVLSNATTRLPSDLDRLGLTAEFDRIFNTSDLGVAKPSPEVFRRVCATLEVAPGECLFADDTAGHVAAARSVGLVAHHFRDVEGLERFLGSER